MILDHNIVCILITSNIHIVLQGTIFGLSANTCHFLSVAHYWQCIKKGKAAEGDIGLGAKSKGAFGIYVKWGPVEIEGGAM